MKRLLLLLLLKSSIVFAQPLDLSAPGSYGIIKNSSGVDVYSAPSVVEFSVSFLRLPDTGYRNNIISKFNGSKAPYPGWAVAIKKFKGGYRLQVYVKNLLGEGGWKSLGEVKPQLEREYRFVVAFMRANSVVAYVDDGGGLEFLGGSVFSAGPIQDAEYETRVVLGTGRPGPFSFDGVFYDWKIYHLTDELTSWQQGLEVFQEAGEESIVSREVELKGFARWLN